MRLGILGPTQILLADGRPLAVGGARLRALLVLLALDAGRVVAAERLIDGLYGANPPANAANALQSQVSRLRQALAGPAGQPAPVEFHRAGYRLAVDPEDVDAHRFTRLAAAGQRALAAGDRPYAAAVLREALDLWRGQPLADVTDAPFARAQAARLDQARLAAVEDRVEAELALGAPGPLVAELRELIAEHPLRERPRGQLMRALYGSGRPAEALSAYEDARRVLAEELGADPSAELAAIHLAVLRADESLLPRAAPRQGLPGQLTSFVGREEELARLGKLLGEARLVTLTGPGGAGKTRLAIEAAGRQSGEVCLVELASLTSGSNLAQAVLGALGLREAGLRPLADQHRDAADRLVMALADRRLTLVLDNCEHVVADAALLAARLLSAGPTLRILATSREPLRLTGEALCPVSGLALPAVDSATPEDPQRVREYAAVQLFVDRAADVAPDFAITAANVDAVLRICRTLDGLPLAIELAAARLRALPVAEIAARLDDRFRLLSRGSRAAQPRHQTLRATVEWSWDLLDPAEQLLARRLTVFAGGATLAAVERVCGAPGFDVVEVLAGLADKSLIEAGDGRYRMLETVRAFCAERLADSGEAERLRATHAAYFLDLAWTVDPYLRGAEQLDWLLRLDAERDNLHATLRRALDRADRATALGLVSALSFYWWLRGLRSEGAAMAGELLDQIGPEPPPGLAEEYGLCFAYATLNGTSRAAQQGGTATSMAILTNLVMPPRQPFLLFLSGLTTGPPRDAQSSAAMRGANRQLLDADPWSRALAALGVGLTWLMDGDFDRAGRELTDALTGFRAIGERWGTITSLATMADLASRRGDPAGAAGPVGEALRLAEELGSIVDMADLLRTRGDGRVRAGDLAGAHEDYERAAELARRSGAPESLASARVGLGKIARLRGDLDQARQLCLTALAECPAGSFMLEGIRLEILVALGRIAQSAADPEAARTWYRQALTSAGLGLWDFDTVTDAIEGLVAVEAGDGEWTALLLGAATALLTSAAGAGAIRATPSAAATRARIGDAAYETAYARGAGMTRDHALAVIRGPSSP